MPVEHGLKLNSSSAEKAGKALIVKFPGIEDRETAVQLIGRPVAVQRERLPEPASGEYYWADLLHMEVCIANRQALGQGCDIRATGANDVLVVEGVKRCSIPFVMDEVSGKWIWTALSSRWDWDGISCLHCHSIP